MPYRPYANRLSDSFLFVMRERSHSYLTEEQTLTGNALKGKVV